MPEEPKDPKKYDKLHFLNRNPNPEEALNVRMVVKEMIHMKAKRGDYVIIKVSKMGNDNKLLKFMINGEQCAILLGSKYCYELKPGVQFELHLKYHHNILAFEPKVIR